MTTDLDEDVKRDIAARRQLAELLGSPEERRQLRQRLGLSVERVAEICGLSPQSIRWRESSKWIYSRGSLTSPEGVKYLRFLRMARFDGDGDRTTTKDRGRASPEPIAV